MRSTTHLLFEWALLGTVTFAYLSIVETGVLDAPSLICAGLAIAARLLRITRLWPGEIPDRAVNALAIACVGFFPVDYQFLSRDFGRATIHLVVFLSSLILVRARTARDFFFVKLTAFLEFVVACAISVDGAFPLYLAAYLACGLLAQIAGEVRSNLDTPQNVARVGDRGVARRLLGVSAFALASIVATAVVLFFILPRTTRAALQHWAPNAYRIPGFANEIRLGQIGEIRLSSTPVMHIRIFPPQPSVPLRWRGSALSLFDGFRWYNEDDPGERVSVDNRMVRLADYGQQRRRGERITYEVQLKNVATDVIFFAGIPEGLIIDRPEVIRTRVDSYKVSTGTARGLRYQAFSFVDAAGPARDSGPLELPAALRQTYLRLPPLDPRIPALAANLSRSARTRMAKAQAIEHHLRTRYGYSMELLKTPAADPLAHFLFERRQGHCEYFASAMAVMLRTIGIPSRVATGFLGGAANPISGWNLIRTSDAHSWVEAWMEDSGWVTFDPTPADPAPQGAGLFARLSMLLDAAELFWQEWIVSYDLDRQVTLAERASRSTRSLSLDWGEKFDSAARWLARGRPYLAWLLLLVAFCATLVLARPAISRWWRNRVRVIRVRQGHAQASDATLLYQRMLELLRRRGIDKPPWMTPNEFARVVPAGSAPLVRELTAAYHEVRFGGRVGEAARMVAALEKMQQRRSGGET